MRAFLRRHRSSLLLAALLIAGAVAAEVAAERDRPQPVLSSDDASPTGALALALWLERLGYGVERLQGHRSAPDASVDLLFVLAPIQRFERADAGITLDWVRQGGVLVYLPVLWPGLNRSGTIADPLDDELGIGLRSGEAPEAAEPFAPFFVAPPARRFDLDAWTRLELRDDSWLPLIEEHDRVLVATRQIGRGRVYAASDRRLFANEGIARADNAAFVLNVLARHPDRRIVAFDEYHHGVVSPPGLLDLARASPWGWAIGYAAGLTFLFILWGGRRFGPPIVPERAPRRSAGEYVAAFAGLLQRARAAGWAQQQYARLVRRRLARALAVSPDLPAHDLARRLAELRPIDPADLADHLAALEGPPLGERSLLARMRAVETALRVLRSAD